MQVPARLLIVVIVALTALVAPPLASTSGAGPAPAGLECGQDVTTDVLLTHDLHCPTYKAFRVLAPDVTVDLGGHTVTVTREPGDACDISPYPYASCSIDIVADSVSLTNGRLVGIEFATFESQSADLSRLIVQDSRLYLPGTRLHHSVVVDSSVEMHGYYPTVDHSWLRRTSLRVTNELYGVIDFGIDANIIDQSAGHGIELHLTCGCYRPGDVTGAVTRNLVVGSTLDGIHASPAVGYGADALAGLGQLAITDNVLVGNGGDGLEIWGTTIYDDYCTCPVPYEVAGPIVVGGNAAYFNGGHGLSVDLQPHYVDGVGWVESGGFVDAGDNRAALNRERPACVGVSCRWW